MTAHLDEDGAVTLWDRDGLWVRAVLRDDGALVLKGEDARGVDGSGDTEYEYSFTVPATHVPKVVAALGGRPGDDPLTLLERHGEQIVRRGERAWLRSFRVRAEFWTWTG